LKAFQSRIFTRRSEWDYSWLKSFPAEVSLAHRYEHARYAILRAAPDHEFVYLRDSPFANLTHLWGPVFCLLHGLPETIKFPQMSYRQARQLLNGPPETLAEQIDEFSHPGAPREQTLPMPYKEINRQQAAEILARFKRHLKRGAGARIRQEQTDLKCLGGDITIAAIRKTGSQRAIRLVYMPSLFRYLESCIEDAVPKPLKPSS
jgi:hypothetical protein